MQKDGYLKKVAKAVFEPVVKSLYGGFPNLGAGFSNLVGGIPFNWGLTGNSAYMNKIYYTATNILVGKLIEAPIIFSKKKPNAARKFDKFYSKSISNEKRFALKQLSLIEVEDHELNKLFDNPNTYQSGMEMMEDFWHNYCAGDGFIFFETLGDELSRNKKPIEIHSLQRDRVTVIRAYDKYDNILEYKYTAWNGDYVTIPKEYMLHLKHWNPNIGDLKGLGVDVIASMDISLNNANNEMQGVSFKQGGRSTVMSSKADITPEGEVRYKMSGEQMSLLKSTVEKDWSGLANYRKTHFTNGELVVQQYGDTLVETEAIKAEESQWKNIFAIVGTPWQLSPVGSSVSENSMIIGYKSLVSNTAVPILRKFDQKLNQKIQQWWPEIISAHDITEFAELAPDLKLMKEVYGSPLLRVDESRAIFGYDEIGGEEGRAILVGSGLMQLSDLLSQDMEVDPNAADL